METVPSRINDRRTCVVTTNATEADIPVHTPNPCAVSISSEVAASIYANFTAETCENWPTPPAYVGCPADGESAAQRLIVLAVSGLLVIFGALAFTGVHSW
ncbi:hypothetical protein BJY01DRAFT_212365 [Aspergillus pseudoustus]|uniref:DUF7136 domain-containing protein n=1 Tax=Aspergillus pseudoustus TaxID=1810923 RepID=A0ABR4K9G0_9EURO